jgi:predicted Na+-dependent transporter
MGCLLVLLAAFAPRLVVLFVWIARPNYVDAVFSTWIFPLLGLIFLPFTTMMWLFLGAPPQGVVGLEWLWIVLAVFLDLAHYGNVYGQRSVVRA